MRNLQHLSVLDNKLEEVPAEIGYLTKLSEMNLTSNKLSSLPHQLYQCKKLTKIHLARNKLTSLPEVCNFYTYSPQTPLSKSMHSLNTLHVLQGITALVKLQVLDVAGNKLSMFPVEVHSTT